VTQNYNRDKKVLKKRQNIYKNRNIKIIL